MMIFGANAAWAQSAPPLDQAEQIRILLERVQQLEKRVAELETKAPTAAATESAVNVAAITKPAAAEAVPPPGPVQGHQHETAETQTSAGQMEVHYPSLQIRGFGDVNFSVTDQKGTPSGFNLGQLDLHLASSLSR